MAPVNSDLRFLLDEIDDWFDDFSLVKPISQFELEEDVDINKKSVVSKNPKKHKHKHKHEEEDEDGALDSLAADLEQLLEDGGNLGCVKQEEKVKGESTETIAEQAPQETFYFHHVSIDDELALLDDTIGNSVTLLHDSPDKINDASTSLMENKNFSVVVCNLSEGFYCGTKFNQIELQNQITTPMPLDHDYFSKPKTKPLGTHFKFKQIQGFREKRRGPSVLNLGALKHFAALSNKFRELSSRHDKITISEN